MQPFQCDLQPQLQETHRTTLQEQPLVASRTVAHTRYLSSSPAATLHGKTQGFVLRLPPQNILTMQHSCSHYNAICNHSFRKRTTGTTTCCKTHRRNQSRPERPQPQPPFFTPLLHYFPSSPLPFSTTSLPHHFPSSPLPFIITSLLHHFPSSPLPFVTTSLLHHFPSSPLPFFTTSLPHHFPSSPLPFIITSLLHHFPFVTTPLYHHFPSSPTLCHSFLFFCFVLLCHLPPFIKVNCIASYSFVMYCYIMYCYVIYHPSSRSTA